jgi:cysteine desulfurase
MDLTRPIYLDNFSTTPVDPKVVQEMLPYFNEKFGNEGSRTHLYGWEARESVEFARERIAKLIKCNMNELYFTSGATESINLALKGLAYSKKHTKKHIITFNSEHKATIDVCEKLNKDGYIVSYLPVDEYGNIDLDLIKDSITEDTFLLTILHGNNEIGNIYPIKKIGDICKQNNIIFHVDGAQTVGKINIDVNDMNIDLLSFSSHKIYGPKGTGGLYIKKANSQIHLESIIHGGGQENNIRPGTLAVQNIVGFGKACEICQENLEDDNREILELRNHLMNELKKIIPNIKINGDLKNRLAGNLNVTIPNIKNSSLMMSLRDIAISNGSACTSSLPETSHVLKAIGLSKDLANSSIRFGIGRFNTIDEINYTIEKINETVNKLRVL